MLLLSSPRNGRQSRASLLLLAVVLLCAVRVSAHLPAGSKCPRRLDCAREGRHYCRPGSSHCGSCLSPLEENEKGRCVVRKRHQQHGKVVVYPDVDEEIDYIHSVIEKQELMKPPKTPSNHLVSPAAITSQTEDKKSKTDAPKLKQKSQSRPSGETMHATTASPGPVASALPNTPTPQPRATGVEGRAGPIAVPAPRNDSIFVILISLCVVVGTVAVILATVCYVKLEKESRLAQKVDYPAFGGAGAAAGATSGTSMGDKTLAQSAQMYHYQHKKQQMLSVRSHKPEQKVHDTEVTSDEEEVGGDFTVYECPGLAPTGEMEVKNPLFDDSTLHYQGNHK
ncbi:neural proliferation differentiation and control protein 1a isoform X1 [Micropterus salmoides]|uniref:neural proliferation differentiation and control protein 1a isoform X1 n=1 Tax=Micropterus salmoides TaxID=27706 RepID=UPI0018EAC050|nr:neural proliferation differentiation and control protein 1a isoform X1 [Micropterus salmoides]